MTTFRQYLLLAIILGQLPGIAAAGALINRLYHKKGYPGSRDRHYTVFLPKAYSDGQTLPLVVVLHGCNQTNGDIMHDTHFNELADAENFVVVYPFITSYEGIRNSNCWGYWLDAEIHQGRGEVADIAGIITEMESAYPIDTKRIHVTGLSAGGAMATAVMVAYSEIIASGASAAGLAYGETECAVRNVCLNISFFNPVTWFSWWTPKFQSTEVTARKMGEEMGDDKRLVPILLLHATSDPTVDITAAKNNAAAWATLFKVDMAKSLTRENGQTKGIAWHYNRYGNSIDVSAIGTHFADIPVHGWLGDAQGTYAAPVGPDWTAIAWSFFKTHPLSKP